ncbi:MAG: hypothetical protein QOC96_2921 [Acidobacteriota bacterium]|jgi:uncharacterized paraquat-inducible protein A|nr:hypothetical protein [Acidobacteriota bacterium]
MKYRKKFHCKDCSHTFEKTVLEAVVSAVCPRCSQWVGLLEFAQEEGLTFGQAVVAGLILYVIFG